MPAWPSVRRQRRQLDERRALEPLPIALGDPIASLPEALEPVELAQPQRGLEVGQAIVVAELDDLVAPGPRAVGTAGPVVTHRAAPLGEVAAVREQRAPLARCDPPRRRAGERRRARRSP